MHAYSTAGWTELFLAEAGASAALPFLFAAMSLLLEAGGGLYWLVPGFSLPRGRRTRCLGIAHRGPSWPT
jgi:hypothetical protein